MFSQRSLPRKENKWLLKATGWKKLRPGVSCTPIPTFLFPLFATLPLTWLAALATWKVGHGQGGEHGSQGLYVYQVTHCVTI